MKVILHCSDSDFGNAALIDSWHRSRGWSSIGYHLVVLNGKIDSRHYNKYFDGHLETGRPFDDNNHLDQWEIGAHTKGQNDSIGVCLIGKSGQFSKNQMRTLFIDVKSMLNSIFGKCEYSQHSDHDPKKPYCAGLDQSIIDKLNE